MLVAAAAAAAEPAGAEARREEGVGALFSTAGDAAFAAALGDFAGAPRLAGDVAVVAVVAAAGFEAFGAAAVLTPCPLPCRGRRGLEEDDDDLCVLLFRDDEARSLPPDFIEDEEWWWLDFFEPLSLLEEAICFFLLSAFFLFFSFFSSLARCLDGKKK